jgi:glycogen synthase
MSAISRRTPKLHVLQVGPFPPPYGGVQRHLVALRGYLRRQGSTCTVINLTRHRKTPGDGVHYPESAWQLIRMLWRLDCDVIHLQFGGLITLRLLMLWFVCTLLPLRRTVLSFHSGGYPSSAAGRATGKWSMTGIVLRRLDCIIAVNEEIAEFLRRIGVRRDRVRVIQPHAFAEGEAPADLSPELARFAEAHTPLLVSVGLLEPEYDLPAQIRLLGELRSRHPRAGLVMIGSGSLAEELRRQIQGRPDAEHILLAGDTPHPVTMRAILEADVLLRTTLYDGDAISVREALYLGTPVIATDNGMRPAGVNLVPASDPAALEAAALRVLSTVRPPRPSQFAPDDANLEAVSRLYSELCPATPELHESTARAKTASVRS